MDEKKLESLLYDALVMAAAKEYDEILCTNPEFTKREERKFAKMLAEPFEYAKRYHRTSWQRIRHYALIAVLALAILAGTIFAIPQTRSIAVDLIRQWFDNHVTFTYSTDAGDFVLPEIEIGYLPEGYKLYFKDEEIGVFQLTKYKDFANEILSIHVCAAGTGFSESIDNELCKIYDVKLDDGINAHIYEAYDYDEPSDLVWTSKDGHIFYLIHGKLSPKELIKVANSIVLQ